MLKTVFLLDVDNTLLDNDRFADDLGDRVEAAFGAAGRARYWALYAELRDALGYADYLGALQKFRGDHEDDPALLALSDYLMEYPFADRLYPGALDAIAHLRTLGTTGILSDGDIVFQPRKIRRAGLWDAVDGELMICVHKQARLDAVQARYPADHYVMVDDKPGILADMKRTLGDRVTTVFVRQGHYAAAADPALRPAPDLDIAGIDALAALAPSAFMPTSPGAR